MFSVLCYKEICFYDMRCKINYLWDKWFFFEMKFLRGFVILIIFGFFFFFVGLREGVGGCFYVNGLGNFCFISG